MKTVSLSNFLVTVTLAGDGYKKNRHEGLPLKRRSAIKSQSATLNALLLAEGGQFAFTANIISNTTIAAAIATAFVIYLPMGFTSFRRDLPAVLIAPHTCLRIAPQALLYTIRFYVSSGRFDHCSIRGIPSRNQVGLLLLFGRF